MTRESAKLSYQDQDTDSDLDLDTDSDPDMGSLDFLNPRIQIN